MKCMFSVSLLACIVASLVQAQNGYAQGPRTSHFWYIAVIFQENRTPYNLFYGLCSAPYGSAASCSTAPNNSQ
jgi:hypothetical protein